MPADDPPLADRLRRLEDLLEIQQLFVDYGRHLDAGDFTAYAGLFADDGELLLGPLGRAKGPAAIEALITRAVDGLVGRTFHLITSPVVELEGDTATAEVRWTVIEQGDDGRPVVSLLGRHRDGLVRQDGRWRFTRREGHIDLPSTYPDRDTTALIAPAQSTRTGPGWPSSARSKYVEYVELPIGRWPQLSPRSGERDVAAVDR